MAPRSLLLLLLLAVSETLLLAGCRRSPDAGRCNGAPCDERSLAAERATLEPEVARLAEAAEALLLTQEEALWRAWTTGAAANLEGSYAGAGALFSEEAVKKAARLYALTDDPQLRLARGRLFTYLASEYLTRGTQPESRAIAELERTLTVATDEGDAATRPVLLRDLQRALASEPSIERRRMLDAKAAPAWEKLGEAMRQREEKVARLLRGLGWEVPTFAALLREVDPESLEQRAESFLDATDAAYAEVLAREAKEELGLEKSALTAADLPRLFRLSFLDERFAKDTFLPQLQSTSAGVGLPLDATPGLTFEATDAAGKHPRPLCLGVKVPGDVRFSVKPAGGAGYRARAASLHELGRAVFLTQSPQRSFTLSKLGPATHAESFGFLFEELLGSSHWLTETAKLARPPAQRQVSALAAHKLFVLRRDAARVLFSLRKEKAPLREERRALYRELFSRALGVPFDAPADARADAEPDELWAAAMELDAALHAASLAEGLEKKLGEKWWANPESLALLREGLAKPLDTAQIRVEPLPSRIQHALGLTGAKP